MVKTIFFCFLFDKDICCQIGKVKKLFKDNASHRCDPGSISDDAMDDLAIVYD